MKAAGECLEEASGKEQEPPKKCDKSQDVRKDFPVKGFSAFLHPKALCNAVTIGCERDLPERLQVCVCSAEVKITS